MELLMMMATSVDGERLKSIDYIVKSEIVRLRVFREQMTIEIEMRNGQRSIYSYESGGAFGATLDDILGIAGED